MNSFSRFRGGGFFICLLISGALSGCGGSSTSLPQGAAPTQVSPQSQSAQVDPNLAWRRSIVESVPLPAAGCYSASYPSYAWTPVACSKAPNILYPLPSSAAGRTAAIESQSVGNGHDFTADVKPRSMSEAIGTFPVVTGVTSVKSVRNPIFPCCGDDGPNSYSLQLNSYFFTSAACGTIKNCLGWEQFVFENPPSGNPFLFIQDWLVPTTASGLTGCPPGKGWTFADGGCVQNSPFALKFSSTVSIKQLAHLEVIGAAATTGDSVFLGIGSSLFALKNAQGDGITDLHGHWGGAEFNVIGNGGGDIADFNAGSTIETRLEADTGVITAPTCPANTGTTGESNNLNFVHAPASPTKLTFPSILFTMSNKTGLGIASCDAVPAI